jgi:hypothetical protein
MEFHNFLMTAVFGSMNHGGGGGGAPTQGWNPCTPFKTQKGGGTLTPPFTQMKFAINILELVNVISGKGWQENRIPFQKN